MPSMTTTAPQSTTAPQTTSLWSRFLDSVLPTPNPERLVRVAEVGRASLPLAEGSLADVGLSAVLREVTSLNTDSRFVILVSARDAAIAKEVLAGV